MPVHESEVRESVLSAQARETGDIPLVSDSDEVAVPTTADDNTVMNAGTAASALPMATPVVNAESVSEDAPEADADAAINLLHDDVAENMQQYVADTLTAAAADGRGADGLAAAAADANTFNLYAHGAGVQAYGQTLSPVGLDASHIPTVEETMAALPPMSSVRVPY